MNILTYISLGLLHAVSRIKTSSEYNVLDNVPSVAVVADNLIAFLGLDINNTTNGRIKELKDKLQKIKSLTIDREKYADILHNETIESDLNQTSFFFALTENDHFQFLIDDKQKNLYLRLKEKMNRDDILELISDNNNQSGNIMKSARKFNNVDMFGGTDAQAVVETEVDKMIAEQARDEHKFNANDYTSIYWDPQGELEELSQHHDGRRIYKGERTNVRYYPFMASIHVLGRFWCGGVIYWHDLVITSAACLQLMHNNRFFRENPKVLQVRIGSNHSRIGGEMVDALEVYFHPGYDPRSLRHNIAVVRLRRHLFFSYHRIPKCIDISHNTGLVPSTAQVLLLGWGVTRTTAKMRYEPVFLQRKFLPVYPNSFCKEVYGDKFITSTMFCAGTMTTGEGACDHDAGGPAVLSGRLVGIISFGPAICGLPNAPTVFTLVGAYADWIETINQTFPDSYYQASKRTTTTTYKPYEYKTRGQVEEDITTITTQQETTGSFPAPVVEPDLLRNNNKKKLSKTEDIDFDELFKGLN